MEFSNYLQYAVVAINIPTYDCTQTMSNGDDSRTSQLRSKRTLDPFVRLKGHAGRCLICNEDVGSPQNSPRNGELFRHSVPSRIFMRPTLTSWRSPWEKFSPPAVTAASMLSTCIPTRLRTLHSSWSACRSSGSRFERTVVASRASALIEYHHYVTLT